MTSWKSRLHEADAALARELPAEQARLLRQKVLAEAESAARRRAWSLPFALTAGSLTVASAALALSSAIAARQPASVPSQDVAAQGTEAAPQAGSGRQQLHFATPGGTRIIWVFDPEFDVKGTLP
jgi:hypothetical protein